MYALSKKRHPDAPREVICVCKTAVGVLLIGNEGEPLQVRTGLAPDKYEYLGVIDFVSKQYGGFEPQWKRNLKVVDGENHQALASWLEGLVYTSKDKSIESTVLTCPIGDILGAGSKLHGGNKTTPNKNSSLVKKAQHQLTQLSSVAPASTSTPTPTSTPTQAIDPLAAQAPVTAPTGPLGNGLFTAAQRSKTMLLHVPIYGGNGYQAVYLIGDQTVLCVGPDGAVKVLSVEEFCRRVGATGRCKGLTVPGRKSVSLSKWLVANNFTEGSDATAMMEFVDAEQAQDVRAGTPKTDEQIIWDWQQRWVEHTPQDVYTSASRRVCSGFGNHYNAASSHDPDTKAAQESEYLLLKKRALTPFNVGNGRTRIKWMNRVYGFPKKQADYAKILFCHASLLYWDSTVISGRVRAGILELSLKDFKDGADRQLQWSMIIPLSVWPCTWKGILEALHYRNWQVILKVINMQQLDFLPSKYLEELRENQEWVRDTIHRWFWSYGDSVEQIARAVKPHALYTMCGLMAFSNNQSGRNSMLAVIPDPSEAKLFFDLWPNKRDSGTGRRHV